MTKDKGTTDFGVESSMAAAVAAAKSRRVPVGGVPMPAMPRLDQPVQAAATQGVQNVKSAQRVLTPQEKQALEERGEFIPGVGSAYAVNQPMVKAKPTDQEGNELPVDPRTAPRPPGSGLREDTVQQLAAVAAANTKDDDELNKINKEIDDIDETFETDEFGDRVRSLLRNKKRAAAIEARCPPLSFEDLLLKGSVQQRVPIIPGRFEPTFRSIQGEESVAILRLISAERGSESYMVDTLSLYNLTAGLYAINSRILPNHLDVNGDFSEDLFKVKYKLITKMAMPILADMSINYGWFTKRVQKLTVVDDIKTF